MPPDRHITWDNFRQNYIAPGVPAVHSINGSPAVRFFVSGDAGSIGIQIAADGPCEPPELMLEQIGTRVRYSGQVPYIEVITDQSQLFEQFYAVMVNIADLVQLEGLPYTTAINRSVDQFRSLLEARAILTDDRVVGLWGELWVLKRLIDKHGITVFDSWDGPRDGVHDFRLGNDELEVKTTRNEERVHIISRLSQLVPSPDMSLYLVSLQLVPADNLAGVCLPGLIRSVKGMIGADHEVRDKFIDLLSGVGYDEGDSHFYRMKYILRSSPAVIPVDAACPRISPSMIDASIGTDLASRISDVQYRINLTGMGFGEDHAEFRRLL